MDHAYLAILMLFIGLALLIVEIFVPSGGMISILSFVCISVSIWAAHKEWWSESQSTFWMFLGSTLVLAPTAVGGALFMLPRTKWGKRFMLETPPLEGVSPYAEEEERLRQLIGKRAKTISLLNPGGMVTVDGERLHCESPGMLIEPGEEVEVTGLKGNRLVVQRCPEPESEPDVQSRGPQQQAAGSASNEIADDSDGDDDLPLDFEIPQG